MEALRSRPISIKKSANIKDGRLGEIYQSMAVTMAILTRQGENEFTRITPFVKCRDFIVDVYSFALANKSFQIYGMEFDPGKEKPSMDGVYLQLIFPNPKAQKHFEEQLMSVLQPIEMINGMDLTEYIPLEEKQQAVLIADKRWLASCLSWSLYTAIVRCLCYDLGPSGQDNFGWIKAMSTAHKNQTDGKLVSRDGWYQPNPPYSGRCGFCIVWSKLLTISEVG